MMLLKKIYIMLRSKNIEDKILDITNLATNTALNAKTNEVKIEIPSINELAATSALTTAETKIPNISDLIQK